MNFGNFIARILQLMLVGLFIAGLFAVGTFVFILTFGVICVLGVLHWLRQKGIIKTTGDAVFTENGAEYYVHTETTETKDAQGYTTETTKVIDVDFQEIDEKKGA